MDVRGRLPSEKRLIDANAMRDDWLENGENEYVYDTNAILDSIDSQPTVDAVEVVRCKDCIMHGQKGEYGDLTCHILQVPMRDDDFCNYGERRSEP